MSVKTDKTITRHAMTQRQIEDLVMTPVCSLSYDFSSKVGILKLPQHCCTDMQGAIKLFQRIDRGVTCVITVAGDLRDTSYVVVDGEWEARVGEAPL